MITRGILILTTIVLSTLLFFTSCDVITDKGIDESLDPVPNVQLIKGAENASIVVNPGSKSNFTIDIHDVEWNTLISNGEREAWCIAKDTPISSDDASYNNIGIYSTEGDENFSDINRLFAIKSSLLKQDPDITWRDIQVAIWVLSPLQTLDLNSSEDLPFRGQNGELGFNRERVDFILDAVNNRSTSKSNLSTGQLANSDTYDSDEKTMCIIGTSVDNQTLIVPCDETAFAYGGTKLADFDGLAGDTDSGVSLDPYAHCFPDDEEISATQWGWSNGKLGQGTYTFPLYAGAGLCNLSKGQYSGDVTIEYAGSTVTVTFSAAPGVTFYQEDGSSETHLYVGSTKMPASGAAPGLYPNNDDVVSSSDTEVVFEVTGVSGDIYVIAHAVMNGFEEEED